MRSARRTLLARAVVLASALVARGAVAQPIAEGDAETHVRRGLDLRRSGDDAAALAEFELAWSRLPQPRVRAQIGLALQALGRWREAEEVQLQVLSAGFDSWVKEHDALLHESLAAVQQHLAWLSVECNVSGAELVVNGASVGVLPMTKPVRVVAGVLVLELRAAGHEPIRRAIDVPRGERARETFVLVPTAPAPSTPDYVRRTVADPATTRRAVAWTFVGAGGVLVAGGIAASIVDALNVAKYNDDKRCLVPPLTRDQQCGADRGRAEGMLAAAVTAFAVGGVSAGLGLTLLVTSSRPARGQAATISCSIAPVSVGCGGEF
jgi:hypothetical protein